MNIEFEIEDDELRELMLIFTALENWHVRTLDDYVTLAATNHELIVRLNRVFMEAYRKG